MNTEKLDYNYRVLSERDLENNATMSQQRRRLTRLQGEEEESLSGEPTLCVAVCLCACVPVCAVFCALCAVR